MTDCVNCGNRDYLCQQCKMEELEKRHGTPADNFATDAGDGVVAWVQDIDETWHSSMYFEDSRHVAACGEVLDTPVADLKDDARFVDQAHTCDACEAYLEDDGDEIPDGGFDRASELVTDGGGSNLTCDLCGEEHDSVSGALRCCSERLEDSEIPAVVDAGNGLTTVRGPDAAAYERERGESSDD